MAHPEDPEDPKQSAGAADEPRPPSEVSVGASERFAEDPDEEEAFQREVRAVRRKVFGGLAAAGLGSVLACWGVCIGYPCFTTGLTYGMWLDRCPSTDLRLGLDASAHSLIRGGEGRLSVNTYARHLRGDGPNARMHSNTMYRGYALEPVLLDPDGEVVPGVRFEPTDGERGTSDFEVHLPKELTDGDYTLRITATAPFETLSTELAVPLFAPALAHVATDRPLYKPGQEVKLRSVLLKRTDLTPLEKRPGRWEIRSPSGQAMLVEKDRAGSWGVADTTFPLDSRAEVGTWTATYTSGSTQDQVSFDVRPFQLPRFAVELAPQQRWYGISDTVVLEGTATYTSGAPVAKAPVSVSLGRVEGRWPMPLDWEEPLTATTDAYGAFTVEIGEVPPDLIERAVLSATARVTEEAGSAITGSTRVILSEDDLMAEAVTELGNGLVGGFNNRAYVRVSTPDGRPVGGARVEVRPAHDPEAEPKVDVADVDGVAAIQLDPGDPVTVVIPAAPVRERPFEPSPPSLSGGNEVLTGSSLSLAERKALDAAVPAIARCGDYAVGGRSAKVGVRVSAGGGVSRVMTGEHPAEACVGRAMQAVRFPSAGAERTYALQWQVSDSLRPWLTTDVRTALGNSSAVHAAFDEAALEARRCMPFGTGRSGARVAEVHWSVSEGSRFIDARTSTRASASGLTPSQVACIGAALARAGLDEPAQADAMGTLAVTLNTPRRPGSHTPRPTTRTAYELAIAASVDGAAIGDTSLVLDPGVIPAMRLRATPSITTPGEEVVVDLLRGPDWRGELPEELPLMEGTAIVAEAKVDPDKKQVSYRIPDEVDGFVHVEFGGARAVIFVRPAEPLAVALSTDQAVYRPGEEAVLTVTTTAGDKPIAAGVGLAGVDSTLGQLAPLLGPDAWGRVTVRAEADQPAFGAFDPKALTLGQVRGDNAAKAAVLRISQLPMDYAGDEAVYASGSAVADDLEVLTRNFYRALVELHEATGAWEDAAAADAVLTNAQMAGLWEGVLDELAKRGEPAVDAFGRPLALHILPRDLLEQCDPRQVVSDATHLPEDIEDWVSWVAEHGRDA